MQKSETDADPPLEGWGVGSKEPTKKIFPFIIIGYNISKLELIHVFLIRN